MLTTRTTWQDIRDEVLRRIHAREWAPGGMIPNELDLAREFGCARATVNRALRELADAGVLDRRRRAGTRVALTPVSKATLDIPVIRKEIETRGHTYRYALISRHRRAAPAPVRAALDVRDDRGDLHVVALHLADGAPYVLEDRWINLRTVPEARKEPFDTSSANEWLLQTAPYTHGDIAFSAEAAMADVAEQLGTAVGAPLFTVTRTTWDGDRAITTVTLSYAPGYRMHTTLG